MQEYFEVIRRYWLNMSFPTSISFIDVIQIALIAVFVYYLILWVQNTRAYTLLKGLLVVLLFLLVAYLLRMTTILYIARNAGLVAAVALVIILQPELRRALEQLGEKNMVTSLIRLDTIAKEDLEQGLTDRTINELVRACFDMGAVRTGALIVVENKVRLDEYVKTGIPVDSIISSQLLINIFEHNTPLHDGAIILRHNRVVAATCYLPLSDNTALSKNLGTRHRAAVGISEVSDSLTIAVSEETGHVSFTKGGRIFTNVTSMDLREALSAFQVETSSDGSRKRKRVWQK